VGPRPDLEAASKAVASSAAARAKVRAKASRAVDSSEVVKVRAKVRVRASRVAVSKEAVKARAKANVAKAVSRADLRRVSAARADRGVTILVEKKWSRR